MEGIEMSNVTVFVDQKFTDDDRIRRIVGLLRTAESAAARGEGELANSYNKKAIDLMTKYGLDQAVLAAKGEVTDKIVNERIWMPDVYAMDARTLMNQIVQGIGAQVIFIRVKRMGTKQSYIQYAHVFAYQSDMNRIKLLYGMLKDQMILGATAAEAPRWENTRSFRKSWMSGFSSAIWNRLRKAEAEAVKEADDAAKLNEAAGLGTKKGEIEGAGEFVDGGKKTTTTSTALVLSDRKKTVESEYKKAHPKSTRRPRNLNGSGWYAGHAAGQRASFGDNHIGGTRKALAG